MQIKKKVIVEDRGEVYIVSLHLSYLSHTGVFHSLQLLYTLELSEFL